MISERVRGWLRLGPSRSALRRELELHREQARIWQDRCERGDAEKHQAYMRAKSAEKEVRRLNAVIIEALTEPGPGESCNKIRFHGVPEADDFRLTLAHRTGQDPQTMNVYKCKRCPRSPVTMKPYFHVGHPGEHRARRQAQRQDLIGDLRSAAHQGRLLQQRISPADVARLHEIRRRSTP